MQRLYLEWTPGGLHGSGGLKNLLHDIGAATSDRFQGMLDRSRVAVRDKLLLTQSRLKSGLNAYFLDKLGFWKHGMYRTLAVFYLAGLRLQRRSSQRSLWEYDGRDQTS